MKAIPLRDVIENRTQNIIQRELWRHAPNNASRFTWGMYNKVYICTTSILSPLYSSFIHSTYVHIEYIFSLNY